MLLSLPQSFRQELGEPILVLLVLLEVRYHVQDLIHKPMTCVSHSF